MSSRAISFRFLQAVTNSVTDDCVTVGVLQWDGERLQFVGDSRKVSGDQGRSTLRRALSAIRSQLPEQIEGQKSLLEDIRDVFPVPEGEGSLLRWTDVRRGFTGNPERHFLELVRLADLADEAALPHVGRREITTLLASLGEQLRGQYGNRIRVNSVVRNHFEYNSPLSWQNHDWHHTVSVNADVRTSAELRKNMYEIMGIVTEAIPKTQGAVLAYVPSVGNSFFPEIQRELDYVRMQHPSRIRLALLTLTEDGLETSAVERMLLDDVRLSTSAH
jgi:hypothetical protein